MITKSYLLVVALLQVALLGPAGATDRKPDECGFASVYSSVSEATASGEDTLAEDFMRASRLSVVMFVAREECDRPAGAVVIERLRMLHIGGGENVRLGAVGNLLA
jgi:hypothetical protein